jgi:hypothetical protein
VVGGVSPSRRRIWYFVGVGVVIITAGLVVVIFVTTKPSTSISSPVPPPPSSHVVASAAPFLRGEGDVIVNMHLDVAAWLADPTTTSCQKMVAKFGSLGTPDAIDTAIGAAPDPVLIDLGADEVSVLHRTVNKCAAVSSSERRHVAVVDATLARRLSQLDATSAGAGN